MMWETVKKVIKDCSTENNGTSYCPFRVSGLALAGMGIPTFIGCAITATVTTGHFDATTYGGGFAAMMGGLGLLAGAVALKAKTDTA